MTVVGGGNLPPELADLVLHQVVVCGQHGRGIDRHLMWVLMEVVLSFVCRSWRERKAAWQLGGDRAKVRAIEGVGLLSRLAAALGSLSLLLWLRKMSCPWDESTCEMAAEGGHLEVLRWAREHGCPWNARTCAAAEESGHLTLSEWARANGCPHPADENVDQRGKRKRRKYR